MDRKDMIRKALIVAGLIGLVTAAGAWAAWSRFTDVTDDHPVDAIEWAADNEITLGCGDDKFCPDEPLTRKHARVFMERFYDNVLGAYGNDQYASPDFTRADMMALLYEISGEAPEPATTTTTAPTTTTTAPTTTTTTTTASSDEWCAADGSYCLEERFHQRGPIRGTSLRERLGLESDHEFGFRFRTNQACPGGWYVEVRLPDSPHRASDEKRYPVQAGETMTIWFIVPYNQWLSGVYYADGDDWGSRCRT